MKPRIGIATWLRPLPTFLGERTLLYTLGSDYVDHIFTSGGVPLLLTHGADPDEVLDVLDGLMLTGGNDVHPEMYGDMHDGTSRGVNEQADKWEIELVRAAAARHMPTLGICRGMQVMAVAFGGRLVQDLAEVEGHPDLRKLTPGELLELRHEVMFEPRCTIASIYGTNKRYVNSIHHQAVIDAGQLRVVGWGVGGVIEALEAQEQHIWPAIGVQWHPEKMQEESEQPLFIHFVEAARLYGQSKQREMPGTAY